MSIDLVRFLFGSAMTKLFSIFLLQVRSTSRLAPKIAFNL